MTTPNTLEILTERNRTFAAEQFRADLPMMPVMRTVIIGCADPRVDPAHLLGLNSGESVVIRNVGGRVTPSTLQTLGLLMTIARADGAVPGGRFDLIVLHHTDCGITRLEAQPEMLADYFDIPAQNLPSRAISDPYASVRADVQLLRAVPFIPPAWVVSGVVYDVHTGRIETLLSLDGQV